MRTPQELDLRGLKCPLPVLRTRKALRRMRRGERLLVLCTDPLAGIDIPHLLREEGDGLEHQAEAEGVARFLIVRGGPAPPQIDACRPADASPGGNG